MRFEGLLALRVAEVDARLGAIGRKDAKPIIRDRNAHARL